MTRINVGIHPDELCDQHLLAEFKELPRAFRPHKGKPPEHFTLGTGHVTWCSQYPGMLADRFLLLVDEMKRRGFRPKKEQPPLWAINGARPDPSEYSRARKLLKERINRRLSEMEAKGERPRWSPKYAITLDPSPPPERVPRGGRPAWAVMVGVEQGVGADKLIFP